MDLTRESITEWLDKNFPGSRVASLDVRGGQEFELACRCWHGDVPMEKFCKVFIDRFSIFSLTNWTVNCTFPHLRRMVFRKNYVCQFSGRNKKSGDNKVTKRNKECHAKIEIRCKKTTRHTIKTDKLLKAGLDVMVKIKFQHSHSIRTSEYLDLLRCNERTKERYLQYFKMGVPACDIKLLNEMYVRLTYADPKMREIQLANGMINASMSKIVHLNYEWRNKNRNFTHDSFERLKQEKELLKSKGIHLKIIDHPRIIVILTPLTKKVFENHEVNEVFVDSSGVAGKEIQYVTSLFVVTKVGALPIGYVIHDGHSEDEYQEGFNVLWASLSEFCNKPFRPKVVITNDGDQLEELARFFPTCSVDLCYYVNLTQFWTYIWNPDNNIQNEDRKVIMTKYYEILSSQSKNECERIFNQLMLDTKFTRNENLVALFHALWSAKDDWIEKSTKKKDSDRILSTQMRLYKETVIRRIQKFNAYVIVKLLTEILEGMYKRYLKSFFLKGMGSSPLFGTFYDKPVNHNILPLGENEYMVQSLTELDQVCSVYTDIMFCTCDAGDGRNGAYCIHLQAVEYEFPFLIYPEVDSKERDFYNFPELIEEEINAVKMFEKTDDITFERELIKQDNDDNDESKCGNCKCIKLESLPKLVIEKIKSLDYSNGGGDFKNDDDIKDNDDDDIKNNDDIYMESNDLGDNFNDNSDNLSDDEMDDVPIMQRKDKSKKEENTHNERKNRKKIKIQELSEAEIEHNTSDEEYCKPSKKAKIEAQKSKVFGSKHKKHRKENVLYNQIEDNFAASTSQMYDHRQSRYDYDEESDIISKGWGLIYRGLPSKQKLYAKKAIDDILFEATLGSLGRNSVVINPNPCELDPIEIKCENEEFE